jgi:hypothetical protein
MVERETKQRKIVASMRTLTDIAATHTLKGGFNPRRSGQRGRLRDS